MQRLARQYGMTSTEQKTPTTQQHDPTPHAQPRPTPIRPRMSIDYHFHYAAPLSYGTYPVEVYSTINDIQPAIITSQEYVQQVELIERRRPGTRGTLQSDGARIVLHLIDILTRLQEFHHMPDRKTYHHLFQGGSAYWGNTPIAFDSYLEDLEEAWLHGKTAGSKWRIPKEKTLAELKEKSQAARETRSLRLFGHPKNREGPIESEFEDDWALLSLTPQDLGESSPERP